MAKLSDRPAGGREALGNDFQLHTAGGQGVCDGRIDEGIIYYFGLNYIKKTT
jgi:hypothetical protein